MKFSVYYGELWDDFNENHRPFFTISIPEINTEQAKRKLEQSKIAQKSGVIKSIDKFNFAIKLLKKTKNDFIVHIFIHFILFTSIFYQNILIFKKNLFYS